MTSSAIVGRKAKRAGYGGRSKIGSLNVACHFTRRRQRSFYCKDTNRKGSFPTVAFDFLGYRFQPRLAIWRGGLFGVSYLPAAAPKALKAFRRRVRNWGLQRRSDKGLTDLARMFNRQIEGWIGYFRCFYKSAALSDTASDRRPFGPMGDAEVQALQATAPASAALARQNREIHAGTVRPLVSALRKWLNAGSV